MQLLMILCVSKMISVLGSFFSVYLAFQKVLDYPWLIFRSAVLLLHEHLSFPFSNFEQFSRLLFDILSCVVPLLSII